MAVDRVFLTVEGPSGRVDVALPDGRPVAELIPTLVEMLEGDHADEGGWVLAAGPRALDPNAPLGEQAADGSVLTLRRSGPPAGWTGPPAGTQAPVGGPDPGAAPKPHAAPAGAPTAGPASEAPATPEASPSATAEAAVESGADRRGRTLPDRLGLGERLRSVAGAVRTGDLERGGDLAVGRRSTTLERARRAWENTDYRQRLDRVIASPRLRRCVTIAVMSPKGGVGKTTSTVLLGTLLAMVRNDRVIAVDYDPDYGTLGRTMESSDAVRVDELVQVLEQPALTVSMLDRCLGRAAHGLMVLPAPDNPERVDGMEVEAYQRVIERLQGMAGILVLDCGAGMRNPFARAAIESADQLVLVTDGSPSTAAVVLDVASQLPAERDYVLVVNRAIDSTVRLDVAELRRRVPRARGLVEIAREARAAADLEEGRFTWTAAPSSWQLAARQLAATLVTGWSELGLAG